ncbi:copper resistance protein NlpE [Arenimonas alkanexedens]
MTANLFARPACAALFLVALMAGVGCAREDGGDEARQAVPTESASDAQKVDRTWLGVLPCADCDGIETRLQLRTDPDGGRYLLEETYLGGPGQNRFVQEGDWREESTVIDGADAVVYRIDPEGAGRWFWLQDDGGLEMLDSEAQPSADGLAYRLQRL